MNPTITCPNRVCKQQHALFWYVQTKGNKVLSYRCDRAESFGVPNRMGETDLVRYGTRMQTWEGPVPPGQIPEVWSPGYSKAAHDKQQGQLVMMYKEPNK